MRILIIGGGGREAALARALFRYGHALCFTDDNPGFAAYGHHSPGDAVEVARRERVDLVVVGPEAPLSEGVVDRLQAAGVVAFGPSAAAARLETSKIYTKQLAEELGLPTASAHVLRRGDGFEVDRPYVVKLDGLAGGKGVWVCKTVRDTEAAIEAAFRLRPEAELLVEEVMEGPELSVLALSDGVRIAPLPPARDHKRRFDGDQGPNTGGMGAVAPVDVGPAVLAACHQALQRTVTGMAERGTPFRGVLYGGFMLTADGPKLLEYNVRFGDPECQPLMALIDEDPAPWFHGAATGRLPSGQIRIRPGYACCVVVVDRTYPQGKANAPITALPKSTPDLFVDQSGTTLKSGQLWATGGRVVGVTALGQSPSSARGRAYSAVGAVLFEGAAWRLDIGR